MLIGGHVSASGGLYKSFLRGKEIDADCIQIFVSSPRTWSVNPISKESIDQYKSESEKFTLSPVLVHGKYLISLGSPDNILLNKSKLALYEEYKIANQINAMGLVFHPGSHRGVGFEKIKVQFAESVNEILDKQKGNTLLLLETSAGSGDHIASNFRELGELIKLINNDRVGVCIDTQHIWASGYDISSNQGLDKTFEEFDNFIGLDKLKAIHLNDSKKEIRSFVDRHENIGDGFIGNSGVENFINRKEVLNIPMYLEVPGITGNGPDKENIDRVRKLVR